VLTVNSNTCTDSTIQYNKFISISQQGFSILIYKYSIPEVCPSYINSIDLIDPIIEEVLPPDYCEEEDPLLYKSQKTSRGPMQHNWLDLYQTDKPPSSVMCAYKLIKVEFRYWGMQVGY